MFVIFLRPPLGSDDADDDVDVRLMSADDAVFVAISSNAWSNADATVLGGD